ncbi:MAG: FlaD/FlaE family flagellar protein [Halobacteriales archaeon]
MTINPREYDLDELREIAHERGDRGNGGFRFGRVQKSSDTSAEDVLRSTQSRELLMLENATEELDTKPYLRQLPDSYIGELIVFEWLEYLLSKSGFSRTSDAINYYASIDWITEDVSRELRDYLSGLDERAGDPGRLDLEDHILSLVYIARLVSFS